MDRAETSRHYSVEEVAAYLDGEWDEECETALTEHLRGCPECRRRAASLARLDDLIDRWSLASHTAALGVLERAGRPATASDGAPGVAALALAAAADWAARRQADSGSVDLVRAWLQGGLRAIQGRFATTADCLAGLGRAIQYCREVGRPEWAAAAAETVTAREMEVKVRAAEDTRTARVVEERLVLREGRLFLELQLSFGTSAESLDLAGCQVQVLAANLQRPLEGDVALQLEPSLALVTTRPADDRELVEVRLRADLGSYLALTTEEAEALAVEGTVPFPYRVELVRKPGDSS